ncbi:kinesin [Trypanosoma theileri]|uniref:Kinesin-like protein n=1 Tax=Trypanosoma theileri TaxID=67003 RepID=A0A1X0NJN6_9TRYP|nr:kinesin [Trypanosoma theileri]ORC84847.1 kinesin [Trypanosoma theileri]
MEQMGVVLRVRPLLPAERERGEKESITVLPGGTRVRIITHLSRSTQNQVYHFDMDCCLGPEVDQKGVFRSAAIADMCNAAFEGRAATVMCFGQTGSGKTYTMSGRAEEENGIVTEDGIQFAAVRYIVELRDQLMNMNKNASKTVKLRASYMELFNERINDLLSGNEGLKCRWSRDANSFFVEDLMVVECLNIDDLLLVLREGQMRRKRAEHLLNADSSRSHVLFTTYIEVVEGDHPARHGKITFVDLAGSERLRDTGNQGDDSKSINRSLFALGNVIEKLSKARSPNQRNHIPYRSSVLTQLLMDSLDGGCRTLLVACVTPSSRFVEESMRTINFAQRTRNIRSQPVERVDATQQELYNLKTEIRRLQAENALLRRALDLPESGSVDLNMLQKNNRPQLKTSVLPLPTDASPVRALSSGEQNRVQQLSKPESISRGSCNSEPAPRLTALDILDQLPSSSGLVARQRPLPLEKPAVLPSGLGFHVVSKKNKLFGL